MNDKLQLDEKAILDSAKEVKCPNTDCDSDLFFPTTYVKKVSALMTGTGKPGIVTMNGPLLCIKCHRSLLNADIELTEPEETVEEQEDKDSQTN